MKGLNVELSLRRLPWVGLKELMPIMASSQQLGQCLQCCCSSRPTPVSSVRVRGQGHVSVQIHLWNVQERRILMIAAAPVGVFYQTL